MDYTSEIAELLARNGFRRFVMSRTQVGHLKLVGHLDGRPIDIVLDTGASKTVVAHGDSFGSTIAQIHRYHFRD